MLSGGIITIPPLLSNANNPLLLELILRYTGVMNNLIANLFTL